MIERLQCIMQQVNLMYPKYIHLLHYKSYTASCIYSTSFGILQYLWNVPGIYTSKVDDNLRLVFWDVVL